MNTTISIPTDVRDQLKEFGSKGDTYEDILRKILKFAKDRQLQELLMDNTDSVPVREALSRARKRWR
jgi:hypothetical protein